jgi:hypothetical protein
VKIVRSGKERLRVSACRMLAFFSSLILLPSAFASEYRISEINSWRDVISDKDDSKKRSLVGSFSLENGNKCSLIVVPSRLRVAPALASSGLGTSKTAPTSKIVQNNKARFGVNGGYFNLSNGESTSYVALNGVVCADPTKNFALTENPKLKPFLTQIYNRSEIRFLRAKAKLPYVQIATHNEPLPPGRELEASLQGGPRLLPELTAEKEAFVRTEADGKQVDSIGVGRTAARTAVGLTQDGYLLIVAVAGKGQDEFSSGLTLVDLARLLKNLGAVEAVNLDGGTSTTMIQGFPKDKSQGQMLIGRTPETRVRSALLVFD